jgi:type IV pilus assembly protein PilA
MHRFRRGDEGFTLIELMVVVLIIAILIAIAIPVFLGARTRAQDRATHSDLRNALTAAKVYYADTEDYGFGAADLLDVHANIAFVAGNAPADGEVGFLVLANSDGTADQAAIFISRSTSGTWFCLADEASGTGTGTYFGTGASGADLDTLAECTGGWTS